MVVIPSTFTCKMLRESDTIQRGLWGDGGEEGGELEDKKGDVEEKGLMGLEGLEGRRVLRMDNLRDGGRVRRREGLGEGR